ncbi:MAG: hypothetical protein J7L16_06195 [Deltaproteobacteria bacterium]|nr:hypothetical protein [Deltaproteobacteria bacterium]
MRCDNFVENFVENCLFKKWIFSFLVFALFSLSMVGAANAHKVMIFAWVSGDTIYTQSKFSGGKKVNAGNVIVYNQKGDKLLEGKTNKNGEFSFKVPGKTALKIVIQAGMGHRAEWTVPLEEIAAEASGAAGMISTGNSGDKGIDTSKHKVSVSGFTPEDVQIAVEKALDKKLKPVFKILAESREHGPSVTDILGGIGYILGLVGVAGYFYSRRQKMDTHRQ